MTNSKIQTSVASQLPLQGRALIEASAGTGKTWTLTGIILRLLIEKKYPAKEIIATTFTRAAAAEMRQRIQERLQDFRQLLIELFITQQHNPHFLEDDPQLLERIHQHLSHQNNQHYLQDSVNQHLLHHLIHDSGLDGLIRAYRLSELALADLSQIFVGTLDSLCQKWLREFSIETGLNAQTNINEDSDLIPQILHHQLRRLQYDYAHTNPLTRQSLLENPLRLDAYVNTLKSLQNFGRAPIKPLTPILDPSQPLPDPLQALKKLEKQTIDDDIAYFNSQELQNTLNASTNLKKKASHLKSLVYALTHEQPLNLEQESLLIAISDSSKGFKKNSEPHAQRYNSLPLIQALRQYTQINETLKQHKHYYQNLISETLALTLREKLEPALEARGESTFSLQLERLNRILESENGKQFARHIAHRYPVLLVDESQDLNHEQASLIEKLYLNETPSHRYFILLVGDPKQAIYGFRGGDVANYNRLKAQFPSDTIKTLQENRRSSPVLVEALNQAYAPQARILGENIYYQSMQSAGERSKSITVSGTSLSQPLIWYQTDRDNEINHIVEIIQALTAPTSRYHRLIEGKAYRIAYQDIMVLMPQRQYLAQLKQQLLEHGIHAVLSNNDSLFNHSTAQEVGYMLDLLLDPFDRGKLIRLLTGKLWRYPLPLDNAPLSEQTDHSITHMRQQFIQASEILQQSGALRALQTLLTAKDLSKQTLWQRIASYPNPDNHRYLLDLRHCLQIISEQSRHLSAYKLNQWWQQQLHLLPQNEWAQSHPLPAQDAVKLLTLHGAKGLQAPVVIVSSIGKDKNKPQMAYRYHDCNNQLYLSFSRLESEEEQAKQTQLDEKKRLFYVGLTRAEDLLFVGLPEKSGKTLALYPQFNTTGAHSQMLASDQLTPYLTSQTPHNLAPQSQTAPPAIAKPPAEKTDYKGWGKTSFSALLRYYGDKAHSLLVYQPDAQQEPQLPLDSTIIHSQEHPDYWRFNLAKGAQTGSFLHELLERQPVNLQNYPPIIERLAHKYQRLPSDTQQIPNFLQQMHHWLQGICQTPLAVSQTTLAQLPASDRLNEMPFSLALEDRQPLNLNTLNTLFNDYKLPLSLSQNHSFLRFIRGEIDLVYRHKERYYIIDYKSNHLGNHWRDYQRQHLIATMNHHQYWLQAAIYQVALHRFLQQRLPNYHPQTHLGSVVYAFIRGMHPEHPQTAQLDCNLPLSLILQIDQFFSERAL